MKMTAKLLVVLMSGLFASSYAMADVVTGTLTGGALVQSITLGATTQIAVSSSNPTTLVSATAPVTTQTGKLDGQNGNPIVSVSTGGDAPTVSVSNGIGSASVLTIQSASATSIIPVIT
ncbi:MAG: hypothetical protein WCH41_03755, partial [Methylophilaceae bacterium]